jgi:hypothetical protein
MVCERFVTAWRTEERKSARYRQAAEGPLQDGVANALNLQLCAEEVDNVITVIPILRVVVGDRSGSTHTWFDVPGIEGASFVGEMLALITYSKRAPFYNAIPAVSQLNGSGSLIGCVPERTQP